MHVCSFGSPPIQKDTIWTIRKTSFGSSTRKHLWHVRILGLTLCRLHEPWQSHVSSTVRAACHGEIQRFFRSCSLWHFILLSLACQTCLNHSRQICWKLKRFRGTTTLLLSLQRCHQRCKLILLWSCARRCRLLHWCWLHRFHRCCRCRLAHRLLHWCCHLLHRLHRCCRWRHGLRLLRWCCHLLHRCCRWRLGLRLLRWCCHLLHRCCRWRLGLRLLHWCCHLLHRFLLRRCDCFRLDGLSCCTCWCCFCWCMWLTGMWSRAFRHSRPRLKHMRLLTTWRAPIGSCRARRQVGIQYTLPPARWGRLHWLGWLRLNSLRLRLTCMWCLSLNWLWCLSNSIWLRRLILPRRHIRRWNLHWWRLLHRRQQSCVRHIHRDQSCYSFLGVLGVQLTLHRGCSRCRVLQWCMF